MNATWRAQLISSPLMPMVCAMSQTGGANETTCTMNNDGNPNPLCMWDATAAAGSQCIVDAAQLGCIANLLALQCGCGTVEDAGSPLGRMQQGDLTGCGPSTACGDSM